jgi:3-oxoacyl-[acyl-carrier-protein] synthase III
VSDAGAAAGAQPVERARGSVIDSIGVALPARTMTTQEVLAGCVRPPSLPLELATGIVSRRVAGDGEYSVDLAVRAARDCFSRSAIPPADVDLLMSTSISRVDRPGRVTYEPAAAARLRHILGCRNAWAFDVANACAGNFTGIYLADAFIRAGHIRTALVVSGEYISHLIRTAQLEIGGDSDPRLACLTLGDAGTAVLLTRADDESAGFGFEHIAMRTIGRYHSLCVAGPTEAAHGGAIMKTDMVALTALGVRHAVSHAQETLARLGHSMADVDRFVPHQTSRLAIQAAIRRVNRIFGGPVLHADNVIDNLADHGNTSTTTHMLALHDASVDGRVRSGQRLLFEITGSGLSVGTAVYSLDDLPRRLATGTTSTRSTPPSPGRRSPVSRRTQVRPVRVRGIGLAGPSPPGTATTSGLIRQAAARALAQAGRKPSEVELLVHAGVYATGMIAEPAVAAIAAGELGFDGTDAASGNLLAFDLTNGGLGLFDACRLACGLIRAGELGNALVAASEAEQREPGVTGSGVAACGSAQFLEADPTGRHGYLEFHARCVDAHIDEFGAWGMQRDGRSFIHSDDRTVLEDSYVEHIPLVVAELLDTTQVRPQSISAVVPPSLSPPSMRRLRRRWPILGELVVPSVWTAADLFTSSLPFGMHTLLETGVVRPGDVAVFACAGSGVGIGAALYRF